MAPQAPAVKPAADIVKLDNVRLSFPALTEFEQYEGKSTGKYTATFLIDKKTQGPLIKKIEAAIERATAAAWPTKRPKDIIITLKDGDDETYDGYAGKMSLKAGRKNRPHLLAANRDPLSIEEANEILYAGCYVNASVDFNATKDGYGKFRVWCNLRGVQFYKQGERFASGIPVNVDSEFDDFSDDSDDGLLDDLATDPLDD
jgi:hypothetical protein